MIKDRRKSRNQYVWDYHNLLVQMRPSINTLIRVRKRYRQNEMQYLAIGTINWMASANMAGGGWLSFLIEITISTELSKCIHNNPLVLDPEDQSQISRQHMCCYKMGIFLLAEEWDSHTINYRYWLELICEHSVVAILARLIPIMKY